MGEWALLVAFAVGWGHGLFCGIYKTTPLAYLFLGPTKRRQR